MLSHRSRMALVSAVAAGALTVGVIGAHGVVADPAPGAPGIGDHYWPLDGNGGIDVLNYRIRNQWMPGKRTLRGKTAVTLRATADLTSLNLDFLLPVSSVKVNGVAARFSRPRPHELTITPATPLSAGSRATVSVAYRGRPGRYSYAGENVWMSGRGETLTMGQPHMATWWFPSNDHPRDKARFVITTTAPKRLTVISNGRLVKKRVGAQRTTWTWRSGAPMATYLAFFAAGDYAIDRGVYRGRPWLNAVSRTLSPRTQRHSLRQLRRTPAIVEWLERTLGTYPFAVTGGLVTGLSPGFALENQTRPIYPATDGNFTGLMVHELAHQWFGDSVSVQSWEDIWLNEGAAMFMEWYWAQTHGHRSVRGKLRDTYDSAGPGDSLWSVAIGDPGPDDLFDWAVYERGAMAFAALRNRIGHETFMTLLRTWLETRRHRNGSIADFQSLAEQLSGEDLDGFMGAWLYSRSRPANTQENGLVLGR